MTEWERFRALPRTAQAAMAAFAVLLAMEIVGALFSGLGTGGGRSQSSPGSTGAHGYAAFAELLRTSGHPVDRLDGPMDPRSTLVVADVSLSRGQRSELLTFLHEGGRAVLAGESTAEAARAVLDDAVSWSPKQAEEARTILPVPELAGVSTVVSAGDGSWRATGPAVPVLAANGKTLAAVADVGRGRLVLLADASPWQNHLLAEEDNAAFGLAAVGPSGPVVFAAGGGATGSGLHALPGPWKAALVLGAIATALAMWSAGRRFGPPEDAERDLPPPRRMYVDALAATLARTGQPGAAMRPLQDAAIERLRARASLDRSATAEQVRAAAGDLGLQPDEINALFGVASDADAMTLTRAMARLGGMSG